MSSDNEKHTIVVVDDEDIVLSSINSILMLETDYQIKTFQSAKAAIDYIEANDIAVVISDYLMPEMDGISFLAEVRKLRPYVPRIILTGYADKENAIKAINEVGLFQYIEKPWENDDLLIILRNGIERKKLMKQLEEKIGEISKAYGELQDIQTEIVKAFV
jgi:DNA-binding NtrC family response regulator